MKSYYIGGDECLGEKEKQVKSEKVKGTMRGIVGKGDKERRVKNEKREKECTHDETKNRRKQPKRESNRRGKNQVVLIPLPQVY